MNQTATRQDIDDVLSVLDTMMSRMDERFTVIENNDKKTQLQIHEILTVLDGFAKRQEISDDERLVMGHQLDRLDRWTHQLADKIGHKLTI